MPTAFDRKNGSISGDVPDSTLDSNIEVSEEANKLDKWSRLSRRTFMRSSLWAASGVLVGSMHPVWARQAASTSSPLRFGVNYLPRKGWLYSWQDWDRQSVAEDLNAIGDLGMDHIRAHCLWPLFQPGPNYVSDQVIGHLVSLLDEADHAGLDVEITVLTGWMSRLSFMPAWTAPIAGLQADIFTNPDVIESEKLLFKRLAEGVGGHKRFLGFDLGNEINVLLTRGNSATPQQADAWSKEMFTYLETVAPGKFHVNGTGGRTWWEDQSFTRSGCANLGKATTVHLYPDSTGAQRRYGHDGAGRLHIVEYVAELAYAYQKDLSRRIWIEETSIPAVDTSQQSAVDAGQIYRLAAATGLLWAMTWWCSHDIDPKIKTFEQGVGRVMGLLNSKNQVKPSGTFFATLAKELRAQAAPDPRRSTALVIPDDGLSSSPTDLDWKYATPYMQLVEKHKAPCIVLESRVQDKEYLRARGITELVPMSDAVNL